MRRRRLLAAGLWALLAVLVWNVRFDLGVLQSATRYLVARGEYLRDRGPRVEMAPLMRAGVADAARAATLFAAPFLLVAGLIARDRASVST
jgi:hypothetical protein